jgi:sialidase-1
MKPLLTLLLLATTACANPLFVQQVVRQQGQDGVHTYRIPGLTTTKAGTLLAVFDIRHKNSGDLPADIDIGLCRSTDAGKTWSPMQTILDFPANEPGTHGNGVGDPSIVTDFQTGTIWVGGLWSHGPRGWNGSGPGLMRNETGQFVLTRSDDDGKTWSEPINITTQVKRPEWRLCLQGPGRGIQLRDGTLVFPAQFKDAKAAPHSFFIASTDHGQTWKAAPPAIEDGKTLTTESQVVELANSELLLSMRNHDARKQRLWATFSRATGKWSAPWFALDDPTCQGSLIAIQGGRTVLFANPASKTKRERMTVFMSTDGGKTWPVSKLVDARPSAYSCLTELADGTIGLLYETGEKYSAETLTFVRFNMEWLTQ